MQSLGVVAESGQSDDSDPWTLSFPGYDPRAEKLREALCTVGNGYLATRGCAPETHANVLHYPGTYVAGVYNRLADDVLGQQVDNESLVNLPNWLPVTFRIDGGKWFDIDCAALMNYRQSLDLRRAVLSREFTYRDESGRTTTIRQRRIVAMHLPHVCGLETTIRAEDWAGTVELRSCIDSRVENRLVERYNNLTSRHLNTLRTAALSDDSALAVVETTQSHIRVALAIRNQVWRDDRHRTGRFEALTDDDWTGHHITAPVEAGQSLTLEKTVTVYTSRDRAITEPAEEAARWLERAGRFGEILDGHETAWKHLWDRFAIDIDDHVGSLRILRTHVVHLLQTVSPHSADLDAGAPARGLHGEAYRGHIFWDELFVFAVLNLRMPTLTRAMLGYRYLRLPEARQAARAAGHAGAMFPWQSGTDGREESQSLHLNPQSGHWNPDPSNRQRHIGIAIAYNVWQYYQATGDLIFLAEYGAEMLVEIARFWASTAQYDDALHRFVIRGVMGPDEFHTGYPDAPYDGIDNNAYTNIMAVWTILRALDALAAVPARARTTLMEKLQLRDAEIELWARASKSMFVPFHDGILSQFEGYEHLAELDWDAYRRRHGNIQRLDRILEAEGDDVNRYKVSKQADVLMLFYLLSADELRALLDRLGYHLAPERIPEIVDYYASRTSHGSTLSAVVHTWVLSRANRDRAMSFFDDVLASDMNDIQGGTTFEGIHLAAMAGSIDLLQRCFSGIEIREDRLILGPAWPEPMDALRFPMTYRDHRLEVVIRGRHAEISSDPSDASPILIECRGVTQELRPGTSIHVE